MRLTHIRLLVNDIEGCREFYKTMLGLGETLAVVEGIYYEFAAGDCILALYKRELMQSAAGVELAGHQEPRQVTGNGAGDKVALTFNVADVDASYKELSAKGVQFVNPPHDQDAWVLRVAHLRDPEGNLIELNAPLRS